MKTFSNCYNKSEALEAAAGQYAFPLPRMAPDEFWPVNEAVMESRTCNGHMLQEDDNAHGLLMHFGCLDAFL